MKRTSTLSPSLATESVHPEPVSIFDLFTIGIGPSSSHTVGPMRAAARFSRALDQSGQSVTSLNVYLYGSLALTGRGHKTDSAVLLGLEGWQPETIDPDDVCALLDRIRATQSLRLSSRMIVPFVEESNLIFRPAEFLQQHPNALKFEALGPGLAYAETYFSVGGGFIVQAGADQFTAAPTTPLPFQFSSAAELLELGRSNNLTISQIVMENEVARRPQAEVLNYLDKVRAAMVASIDRGCTRTGVLPGPLKLQRRAPQILSRIKNAASNDALTALDMVSVHAIAASEENAAGGRIVTAPTNGAAGVIPAVLKYCEDALPGGEELHRQFLMTAAAIGSLYKSRASISAAEVGCQGEIGVACSMAAAGLAAAMGGTNEQIENAAEIGMEHNLGLTCDPVGGLVQVPCIERNAMGAIKAINAARLALMGEGKHLISLDSVIETMLETGRDLHAKYKETSLGGLAIKANLC